MNDQSHSQTYRTNADEMKREQSYIFPASFAQRRLWFLDQLEPGNAVYNLTLVQRLRGSLNVQVMEDSLNEIVRRHESLRTRFEAIDGEPMQVVEDRLQLKLELEVIGGSTEAEREETAEHEVNQQSKRPFDLKRGPLLRATLLRLEAEDHVLLLVMHHIVADGWSLSILFGELGKLYEAYCAGRSSPLPELAIQYADFSAWQHEWLQGEVLDQQLGYWKQQLHGAPELLQLPTDYPRPLLRTFQSAVTALNLSVELHTSLTTLCRQEGVTLFMLLMTTFQIILQRETVQDDVVVGFPIAGRNREEIEPLIGFFVNTLLLRTNLSGNPSFRQLLAKVMETALGAYAHQDLPFEKLVEVLRPRRELDHVPLFQVFFNVINIAGDDLQIPGLDVKGFAANEIDSKFDLTLYAIEFKDRLRLRLVYNSDLFKQERMSDLLDQFQQLLTEIIETPDAGINDFALITPAALKILPNPSQPIHTAWTRAAHQLFSDRAKRAADSVAVSDDFEAWTYKELDARSNQLANCLIDRGLGRRDVIAIWGHRSAALVWAMLGVLKAGAAFVIVDPIYPASRLIEQLRVASPRGWLQLERAGAMPADLDRFITGMSCRARLILQQRATAETNDVLDAYPINDPGIEINPDDLAYVAFTSGSTGAPKGILGGHGPLSHFLQWHSQRFDLTDLDRFSMLSGLAHDPLLRDIFTPLSLGAALYIPDLDKLSPNQLVAWMGDKEISVAHLTPAMVSLLAEGAGADERVSLPSLRHVFIGGDVLSSRHLSSLHKIAPAVSCVNFYGATETPQAVGYFPVPAHAYVENSERLTQAISIGKGIDEVQLLVLNDAMRLVGLGEVGEIYVRTPYLSKGYISDEALTNERFIVNPFTQSIDDRMYRTGDLARYRPDGNIDFLGRRDQQVKVRGFRIELGEVEAVLRQHAGIREAVVLAREDEPGDKRLVAYLVSESELGVSELREWLKQKLPEYMVPTGYVWLAELPLTANGKVDRAALPAPEGTRPELADSYVAPRTAIEEVVAGIWSEVLKVERVGMHDNFFELGGHSLLAVQVVSRLQRNFEVEIPLRRLFESPSTAQLSAHIEAALRHEQRLAIVDPIRTVRRDLELPLSFAQQRLWFLDQLQPGSCAYNMPAVIRLRGELNVGALERSLSTVVARHEVLRSSFPTNNGQAVQMIGEAEPVTLTLVDLSGAVDTEQTVTALLRKEVQRPFDLSTGPVFRSHLLRLGDQEHVLVLVLHHIVADGWSLGLLMKELWQSYRAEAEARNLNLAALPIQYVDYAVWQRAQVNGTELERQLSHWRKELAGAPRILEIFGERARPSVQSNRGATRKLTLSRELSEAARGLSRKEGVTLFMLLLAAFKVLLSRYSGQEDVVVGSPIAGRNRTEIEGLIGFFANTLVLRTDLSGNPTFRQLLKRVRETALRAYTHQDLPFEQLVEQLHPERDLSHSPIFQVMFVLQNVSKEAVNPPGLELTYLATDREAAKFDLTLSMLDTEQGLIGNLEYNTDLFDSRLIDRMVGHFEVLLEGIVAHPEQRVGELPLLSRAEREQLLVQFNETKVEYVELQQTIHGLFEAQMERRPEAVAVRFGTQQVSYEELNRRANQVAWRLRRGGVGPEVLVGVLLERSVALVVGLLGVLKAGGAYVPLDGSYPEERLRFMVADAGVTVLLTEEKLRGRVSGAGLQAVYLDGAEAERGSESAANPESGVRAENLAYVIYTSGSTGRPKGVAIAHRSAAVFVQWAQRTFASAELGGMLASTSICFDLSVFELFAPLTSGGVVLLAENALELGQVAGGAVRLINTVPSAMAELVRLGAVPASVQRVNLAGEPLPRALANELYGLAQIEQVTNLYGPTEATTYATWGEVGRAAGAAVTIGRPVDGTQVYILDKQQELVPVGVSGELYLGGEGLARGYLGGAGATAEKFVPHPYSESGGARLYRTGDMGRYRGDGEIEYQGRRDQQVKVRGFRIELGEVEAVLRQHASIREAVVLAREDEPGDKRLVAYLVSESELGVSELREWLKQKLPEYMVPTGYVWLAELPLTANGKVDRAALPAPEGTRPELADSYVAPRTAIEEVVARIWSEVLKVERVGLHDNFFALGGDSLKAIQVISRVQSFLEVELRLRAIFEAPTVAELCLLLSQTENDLVATDEMAQLLSELQKISPDKARELLFSEANG